MGCSDRISLRGSLSFAWCEFIRWIIDPKMILFLISGIFVYQTVSAPLLSIAEEGKAKMSIFEPVIAVGSSGLVMLILPLLFLVMVSDYPSRYSNSFFSIVRIGRRNWLISQYIQGIFLTLAYQALFFLMVMIPLLGKTRWKMSWSRFFEAFFRENKDAGGYVRSLFPTRLYYQMSLPKALLETYLFLGLYLYILLLVLLTASLYRRHIMGTFLCGGIVIVGSALCSAKTPVMWAFPMAHSVVWLHYTEYFRKMVFSMEATYLYFAFVIGVLIYWQWGLIRTYSYGMEDEHGSCR